MIKIDMRFDVNMIKELIGKEFTKCELPTA